MLDQKGDRQGRIGNSRVTGSVERIMGMFFFLLKREREREGTSRQALAKLERNPGESVLNLRLAIRVLTPIMYYKYLHVIDTIFERSRYR